MNNKLNSHMSSIISSTRLALTLFIFITTLLLTACQQQLLSSSSSTPEEAEPATALAQPSAQTEAELPGTPGDGADVIPGQLIPDEVALRLMYDLSHSDDEAAIRAAIDSLQIAQDERFVPVLIEMLRFGQIGIT